MKSEKFNGINIQYPISQEILSGRKIIETRTYPIPKHYVGKILLLVETPGSKGKFTSRIVAKISFSECFQYDSEEEFYRDTPKHRVSRSSPWAWNPIKPKWGWIISEVTPIENAKPIYKRLGIKFTKDLEI